MDQKPVGADPERQLVIVGSYRDAQRWAQRHGVDLDRAIIADHFGATRRRGRPDVYLVLLPSYRNEQGVLHCLLRAEVRYLQTRGATLEWA